MTRVLFLLLALLVHARQASGSTSLAPELHGDESSNYQVEVVVENLHNPFGIVIRPGTSRKTIHEILIAESGLGRIVRMTTDAPDRLRNAIVDFPVKTLSYDGTTRAGPLGLAMLSASKLVVANCGVDSGQEDLAVYSISEQEQPIQASEPTHRVGPLRSGSADSARGWAFFSLAVTDRFLYASAHNTLGEGSVLKTGRSGSRLEHFRPLVSIKRQKSKTSAGGLTIIPQPRPPFLVGTDMGKPSEARDSRLLFFVPMTGELAMTLDIGLMDAISLAYSPSGKLYAADWAVQDRLAGAVYRLDDARIEGRRACRAVRIAQIPRPVGLAFTPDGELFVTSLGERENAKQGQLLKITGKL